MKGQVLAFVVTIVVILAVIVFVVVSLMLSVSMKSSQANRIVNIVTATSQPLTIANGLVQARLLDGRTMLDNALHALGGAKLILPPSVSNALLDWNIDNWNMIISGAAREIPLGLTTETCTNANEAGGQCTIGVCPPGSYIAPSSSQCAAGQTCCAEDYNADAAKTQWNYNTLSLRGSQSCGPDYADGVNYYGVCEPGGCSPGRKDIGRIQCADVPIGNHCCRPLVGGERITAVSAPFVSVMIPLLYPGMSGNFTINIGNLPLSVTIR